QELAESATETSQNGSIQVARLENENEVEPKVAELEEGEASEGEDSQANLEDTGELPKSVEGEVVKNSAPQNNAEITAIEHESDVEEPEQVALAQQAKEQATRSKAQDSSQGDGANRAMLKPQPASRNNTFSPEQLKKIKIIQSLKTAPGYTLEAAPSSIDLHVARIYFAFNDATLTETAQDVLASLAVQLLNEPEMRIKVIGNTDALGSAQANQVLSQQRAGLVVETLKSLGVSGDRIERAALAYNKPLNSNDDWQGRQRNRRVDIELGK
ncbi:MAG: OmpA family protein, partial [Bdellovibrionales bacterium]|nr:OmpA family protein [Bdellovibrionales bacterium]